MKRKFALFFFLLCMNYCFAQDPYFRHFGVEQGLPSSEVYDILQDRNGFIWIATDRGVSKYDGYSFHNFSSSDGLTDNTVFMLTEDTSGNIWCATMNSKLCYFSGEKIIPYEHNTILQNQSQSNRLIQSLDVTAAGDISIGYQMYGCLRIDHDGKILSFNNARKDTVLNEVHASENHFAFGSLINRQLLNKKTQQWLYVEMNGKILQISLPNDQSSYYITGMRKKDGTLLIGKDKTLIEISPDLSYRLHTFESRILRINEDNLGNSWISHSGKGVRQYAPGADLSGTNYSAFLPDETVIDVMQDNEGGYWMSTLGHGIFYLVSPRVHCLLPINNKGTTSVTAIASKPNGAILLGTSNGFLYSCTAGKITSTFNCNSTSDNSGFIQDIYVSPGEGDIWICTNRDELYIAPGGHVNRINGGYARTICGDTSGGSWMGGTNWLMHYSPGKLQVIQKIPLNCRIDELFRDTVTGKLLVGNTDGLYWLNGNKLEQYLIPGEELNARVSAIKRTTKNTLVIGTIGKGICIIKNDQRVMIDTKQGLCSPIVNDLDIDKNGDIWAATNAGIAQLHWVKDTFIINCFSIYHGLPTNEIRKVLCKNDTIWIGTTSGAAWFIPHELEHTIIAPPIFIQEILVNGEKINPTVAGDFSYAEKQIRISFLGISYRNGGNTTYRYRLAGIKNDWTYTSNRSVEYASLPPGNYSFEVMARNGDGTWSNTAASFGFAIHQPYWYTWWFWTTVTLLFAGAGWWGIQRWLRNAGKDALQKRLLGEYQHQALAAQMNPHFIFNSLSSMQAFVLGDEKENALRYIDRFSFLMRKSLEHSMLKFVPLENEIELLRAYLDLEAIRFGEKLSFTIVCESFLETGNLEVPTMVIQPFVENSVRHGLLHREEAGGKIMVSFTQKDNSILCCVEDNGVGRKRSMEINRTRRKHISFGSSITEERLRLLCDVTGQPYSITYTDKTDKDGHSAGTFVCFILPSRKREQHVESAPH